jgi:hypothetical protein
MILLFPYQNVIRGTKQSLNYTYPICMSSLVAFRFFLAGVAARD